MPDHQPDGYLTGTGRPVLVLHAWWGLNDTIKAYCTQLADAGFVAFAPDLYHGRIANDIAEAETLASVLFNNLDPARAEVVQAAAFLRVHAADSKLAVIGFSLGAFFALDLSITDPEHVRSVIAYYGTRPGDYSGARAAYLGHFAETDAFEAQSDVDALEDSLKQAGRPVTFYRYSGTGHWFCEPDRLQAYHPAAADLAWERTLAFLRDT